MELVVRKVLDKLSIKYMISKDEFEEILQKLKTQFPNIQFREWSSEDSIFMRQISIKTSSNSSTIFLGFHSKWFKPHRRNNPICYDLFVVFNPFHITKQMLKVIRALHGMNNREWEISLLDYAMDLKCEQPELIIVANRRKERNVLGTLYYGKRHSRGHLKSYDKQKQQNIHSNEPLTRIEFTYRPDAKNKTPIEHPLNADISTYFNSSYSIHYITPSSHRERERLTFLSSCQISKLSKPQRKELNLLKEGTKLSLYINKFDIIKQVFNILNDRIYITDFSRMCLTYVLANKENFINEITRKKRKYHRYLASILTIQRDKVISFYLTERLIIFIIFPLLL